MKEYALILRMDILTKEAQPTPEQMKEYMQQWMKWINEIAAKGQLVNGGNHFKYSGINPSPFAAPSIFDLPHNPMNE